MTTLDGKALKAAKAVEGMPTEYVIRAYLDALPPAKRVWIENLENPFIRAVFETRKPDTLEYEIREVRS